MLFNLTFDQSDANLPAGFKAVAEKAKAALES